jgi:hypothetical protein
VFDSELKCLDSSKKIFVIPHFHYDLAWISTEQENLKTAFQILEKVMEIMEKDRDFTYVVDQSFYLEKMKEQRPRVFRKVAERIREGRIEVVNGGHVMPDLNLISPSTIKGNFEVMNDFAREEFNVKPQVAWMIDCFGHPGIMPKIAKETGLKYYVFWRGMIEPEESQEFLWTGTDGSTVLTHWMKHGYALFGYRFNDLTEAANSLKPTTELKLVPFGADFSIPDEKLVQQVHATEDAEFALPSEFFRELEKHKNRLPTVRGEMLSDYANFRGYYSSRMSFKQLYRQAESELLNSGASEEDWKNLLYSTFHDLICGTGIDKVYPEAERRLKQVKVGKKARRRGKAYSGNFLRRISFELMAEEGDLYRNIPSVKVTLPKDFIKLSAYRNDSALNLSIKTDSQWPRHVLRLVVKTGVKKGALTHHLWKEVFAERRLNTLYAFNDFFELKDCNGDGFRFSSDDCFDYEVKESGDVCFTLVRSVQILSHGDAGPRTPCPGALELGKHRFEISVFSIGKETFS